MKNQIHAFTIRSLAAAFSCALTLGTLSAADTDSTGKSFIKDAYQDGLAEIKMGELGVGKTANPEVKNFAQRMIDDHTAANTELKSMADLKSVEVASGPSLMAQGKTKLLDTKSGGDFDKAFVNDMVSDHEKAVKSFEKAATESSDPDVKAFANKTLPTLKSHLSMAQELQQKIGKP